MGISKYTGEGYYDPTAYEALTNIAREERLVTHPYRPLVYICSPYAGDVPGNTKRALQFCRFAVKKGAIPFAPHLFYPQFMDERDKEQRELALFFGRIWLRKCDALWYFGDRITEGMARELQAAVHRGLKIRHFNDNFEEVQHV